MSYYSLRPLDPFLSSPRERGEKGEGRGGGREERRRERERGEGEGRRERGEGRGEKGGGEHTSILMHTYMSMSKFAITILCPAWDSL